MSSVADQIRFTAASHVQQARLAGQALITIRAGDIVKELNLMNKTPSVCSALASRRFQQENGVSLERREGPPSGQSTTTLFTYRIGGSANSDSAMSQFESLRGVGKDVFEALGGGEKFLGAERQGFGSL